ncbi:MAG: ribosomal large subunit methyltransferase, partial [Actinomycetota bacterium]
MIPRYGATRAELDQLLVGEPRYRVDQVWKGLYTELSDPVDMTALPKALRSRLD